MNVRKMEEASVWFVGAGPGDPELITLKGKKAIELADTVIYAGSLVNPQLLAYAKPGCEIHDSASMTLEEVIAVTKKTVAKGQKVARVHTGDPSIYGAIHEQMDLLDEDKIDYYVIPGVSSFTAAAAALGAEFTLPSVSQTVILTRAEGRTPVPEKEKLALLAKANASMAIFLSVQMIDDVVHELLREYPADTPVAVIQKASWQDEQTVAGTLSNIGEKVRAAGITKTAQILVGRFLQSDYERSKLYDPTFTHEFRQGIEK